MFLKSARAARRLPTPAPPPSPPLQSHEGSLWQAERHYWRARFSSLLANRFNLTLHPLQEDDATVPSVSLVGQIQNTSKANPDVYFATAYRHGFEFLHELQGHGFVPEQFKRILEFGVGSGRLLRQFIPFGWELFGCDVTADLIDFARRVLGEFAHLSKTDIAPPLPYESGSFDFVYAVSVFTHIQMSATQPWIEELRRVIRPGGALIVTVFEANHYLPISPREFDQVESGPGYLEWGAEDVNERFMYMTPARLFETWGQAFEVLELRPRFRDQSHLIMRRR